jgi:acyl-[acyl-carrier-protein]-phospholipid O-acyltransferase/long-chain-fatty-acid--[acyl-carrier-protein] ligase
MIAVLRVFARLILRMWFRVEVRGADEALATHPEKMLVVANHTSFLDGILLDVFLPLRPTYLIYKEFAALWYWRLFLWDVPHLPIDSRSPLAMKSVIGLLDKGDRVVIFPEGRVTVTGSRMKVYDGPAFAVAKTGASVLPVQIEGAQYSVFARQSGLPRKWFPKITLTMHPPRTIEMPVAPRARDRRRLASEQLRRIMQEAEARTRKDTTIPEAVLDAIKLHGRGRGVVEDIRGKDESYGQFLRMMLALGRLTSKFTAEGEVVGVLLPTATTAAAVTLGLMAMRRVPAMLNYTSGREGMEGACKLAKVKTIFTSRVFVEKAKLGAMLNEFRGARVLYLEDLRPQFGLADKLWLMLFALRFPRAAMRRARPEQMAVVLFTSGSEGRPKGVALSHRSILSNCAQIRAVIEFGCRDKFLNALPLFHSFGLVAGTILPLVSGARIFFYPSPLHYRVIPETIYDRDCTVLFATSTFLANYARFAHVYDFYKLRYVISGAEKLSEEVRKVYADRFGIRILEGYGASECSPVISVNTPLAQEAGTVGEPLPLIECRVLPVEGIENGGELHVRGPNVMLGYLREDGGLQPPCSELGEGWYDTGDVVRFTERGSIVIQARLKRFAKVAGEMVSLETVERIAHAASPIREHASTAWKDEARGELIALFTDDPNLKREHLQHAARDMGLPEIAVPRRVIFLNKLPLLANGKKDYIALGAMTEELVRK